MRSDPGCGSQFYTGPACTYGFELYARDGTPIASHPVIAPLGGWGDQIDVEFAARDDGYLVTWPDRDGFHVVHVGTGGVAGAPRVISGVNGPVPFGTLAAVSSGYVYVTTAPYSDASGSYRLPRLVAFAPDGSLSLAPVWLTRPAQPFTQKLGDDASVATRAGGLAVAWRGQNNGPDFRYALQLRQVGCGPAARRAHCFTSIQFVPSHSHRSRPPP